MNEFNLALTIASGTVLGLGLIAGYIANKLWIAETAICLMIGVLVGPAVLGLATPDNLGMEPDLLLKEVARVTLGLAVMGAALRLPARFEQTHWKGLVVSVGLGMPLMWLTAAVLCMWILGQPLLVSLLIGAVLAPTDPVVAGSIASGKLAETKLAGDLRNLLTLESGANDGFGMLFVMLPILLLTKPAPEAWSEWAMRVLLWEVVFAVMVGLAAGWLGGKLLMWAREQPFSEHHSTITVGLALSLAVLAAVRLIGSDGILAVFAAGLMLNRAVTPAETNHGRLQEAIGRFFDLPVFILIGVLLPWKAWMQIGWPLLGFAAAVLIFRRLPWWMLIGRFFAGIDTNRERAFLGWFGPMGVASTYYAMLSQDETQLHIIWPVVSLTVVASVVIYGSSATPLTQMISPDRRLEV